VYQHEERCPHYSLMQAMEPLGEANRIGVFTGLAGGRARNVPATDVR